MEGMKMRGKRSLQSRLGNQLGCGKWNQPNCPALPSKKKKKAVRFIYSEGRIQKLNTSHVHTLRLHETT